MKVWQLLWYVLLIWVLWFGSLFLVQQQDVQIDVWSSPRVQQTQWVEGDFWVSPYGVQDNLLERMSQAKYSLDMWFYRITLSEAEQIMKNLSTLWVWVRRIGENRPYEWLDQAFLKTKKRMEAYDIQVLDDEQMGLNFNHTKVMIRDDSDYLISTANLTYTSMARNREYRFVWDDPEIAQSLQTIFDKDLVWNKVTVNDIHPRLLVCPVNCRQQIETALQQAQDSIVIQAQYIQDQNLITILENKSKEVDVQIILGKWQDEWWLDNLWWIPDRVRLLADPYVHAKNILIDNDLLIMGSMNLSQNALDNNREIGILIDDTKAIKTFARQFKTDRDAAKKYEEWNFETDWF